MTAFEPDFATRRDWLRLARTDGVGPVTFAELIRRFGDPASALDALPDLARRGGRAKTPNTPSREEAEAELAAGEDIGARLLISAESAFPRHLAAVDGAPPLIWTLGKADLLCRPCVGIVGARNASAAGQRFAGMLAQALGGAGYTVVSGLARGVDGAAHAAGLATGTAAVLGGGVNDIYPPQHAELYERIANDGCIISESRIGHRAQAKDFPRRNRIISGLSLGVIVVEAEMRSGSLITARLAGEQGREVFAVPGSPMDPRAAGCNELIRQGATLCTSADDVISVLDAMPRFEEPPADWDGKLAASPAEPDDALRERIAELLSAAPVNRDELVRLTGGSAAEVSAALIELSLAGRAELLAGGMVVGS